MQYFSRLLAGNFFLQQLLPSKIIKSSFINRAEAIAPCSPDEVSKLFTACAQRTPLASPVGGPNDSLVGGTIAPGWYPASVAVACKAKLVMTGPSWTDPKAHEIVQNQLPLWTLF